MSEYHGQTIISENMIFMNIMNVIPFELDDGQEIRRLRNKWSSNTQSILKLFQRMRKNDKPTWFIVNHSYIKQTIILYTRKNGNNRYSTGTIGMTIQLQYMASITKVKENLQYFKNMIDGFKTKYDNMKFEIFFGMNLNDYNIQSK